MHKQHFAPSTPSRDVPNARGFTLIEMMVVIAIIAILALIALPSMFERTIKVQVRDGMALANLAKGGVAAAYARSGEMPANNEAAGIPPRNKIVGDYVAEVGVADGAVTITFGNNSHKSINGKHLTLRPAVVDGQPQVPVTWLCANRTVPTGMTAMGTNATDIALDWLPVECRK